LIFQVPARLNVEAEWDYSLVFESVYGEPMNRAEKAGNRQEETVLIVDDESEDLRFTHGVVAAACPEFCIRSVRSGEELIRYIKGENGFSDRGDYPYPDLVLMDLMMPGMHGFDALLWLRNHPPHDVIPVVVLTVSGDLVSAQYAYELGARSFLTKPLKPNEIKETVGKLDEWVKQVNYPGTSLRGATRPRR
jgi:CheY-like chemotaxis protein